MSIPNNIQLDSRYTTPNQVDSKIAAQAVSDTNQYATQSSVSSITAGTSKLQLNSTTVKTATYTALPQDLVLTDASSSSFSINLPSSPADATLISVKKLDSSANTVTVSTAGSDTYAIGGTSLSLSVQGHSVIWRYFSSSSKWVALSNDLPLASIDLRYTTPSYVISAVSTRAPNVTLASNISSSYSLVLNDASTALESTSSSAVTITIPANSSVGFPVGTMIEICQYGTGQLTISPASGVTVRTSTSLILRTQYSTATIRKRASDEWILAGDLY